MSVKKTDERFVTYTVAALTRFEAVSTGVSMLRKDVRLVGEPEAVLKNDPWWDVTMLIAEDYEVVNVPEHADDMTFAKWAANR